jgi:hypothetical protein
MLHLLTRNSCLMLHHLVEVLLIPIIICFLQPMKNIGVFLAMSGKESWYVRLLPFCFPIAYSGGARQFILGVPLNFF